MDVIKVSVVYCCPPKFGGDSIWVFHEFRQPLGGGGKLMKKGVGLTLKIPLMALRKSSQTIMTYQYNYSPLPQFPEVSIVHRFLRGRASFS